MDCNFTAYPLLNTVAKYVSEWFMLIALLGFGRGCLNSGSMISIYMSKRSSAFYWDSFAAVSFGRCFFR